MRSAPHVVFPVGRFVWGGRIVLALAVLALSGPAFMMVANGGWRPWVIGMVCLMALASSWSWWRGEVLRAGHLSWDGQSWYLLDAVQGQDVAVGVMLCWDAGPGLLLKISEGSRSMARYAWLQGRDQPQQWHALRCAVHARDTL